ncbi:MAG TPA: GNAT family N-acetyltransferase [Planctomycetota bacterium]|nr:GNAT family N-acetyltransferase [Planctomycetota bacterium]
MPESHLRPAVERDRPALATLICESTNAWYVQHGKPAIFPGGPATTTLFAEVYEALDPGCCVVAEHLSGCLMGSCFFHPRPTHVALGIMNVHPDFFGAGVARALLGYVTALADGQQKPVRLVSSAQNLDSFSLYTRAGFVSRCTYQDMYLDVPASGLAVGCPGRERVRPAHFSDVPELVVLEEAISGIRREQDWRFFIRNLSGIWGLSVIEGVDGGIDGVLGSVCHPGSTMLGPGLARDDASAAALIHARLDALHGKRPVFLVPCERGELVRTLYGWGARNCEIHLLQIHGHAKPLRNITNR